MKRMNLLDSEVQRWMNSFEKMLPQHLMYFRTAISSLDTYTLIRDHKVALDFPELFGDRNLSADGAGTSNVNQDQPRGLPRGDKQEPNGASESPANPNPPPSI